MTKLRDMVRKVKKKIPYPVEPDYPNDPYPWGLRINLNGEELDKLDIKLKNLSVDDKIKIEAVAYVESIRQSKNRNGEDRNLELQITKMAVKKTKIS
jgi:hypothetical protein